MAQAFTSMSAVGGSQGPPVPTPNNTTTNIYMMNVDSHLSTKNCDYRTSKSVEKEREAINSLNPIQI
jgi:hypothetical protein